MTKITEKTLTLYKNFMRDGVATCPRHGEHSDFHIRKNNRLRCRECEKLYRRRSKKKNPINCALRFIKHRAKKKGIAYSLNRGVILYLLKKQEGKCALSGLEFSDHIKMSVDRIDPSGGYTPDNVQLLALPVNHMKLDFDQDYFIKLCGEIYYNGVRKGSIG